MTDRGAEPEDGSDGGEAVDAFAADADLLEEIQDLADVGYWRHDLESDEITGSRHWYELWGLDPDEAADVDRDAFLEMVHPDDRPALRDARETARRKRAPTSVTFRVERFDGGRGWIASRFLPEVEGEEVVALRGVSQDVTERKTAEEELREERDRLQEAQRVAGVGSWEWDLESDTLDWSRENYRIMGLDPEEAPEPSFETVLERIHPDDQERVREQAEEAVETGEVPTVEYRVQLRDGSVRWCRGDGEAVVEDGEVVALRGTNLDITEEKEAERALRRERERLQEAQRVAGLGSWEYDVEADELHWTDELYHHLGWEPGEPPEPRRRDFVQAVHPDDRERVDALVDQALEEREFPTFEFRVEQPDGSVRWFESRGEVVTEDGEIVRIRGTRQDITERKRLEERLQEERDRLEEAQEIGSMGHWRADRETGQVTGSRRFLEMWGFDPDREEPIDRERFLEKVHPEDRRVLEEVTRTAVEEREPASGEFRVRRGAGSVVQLVTRVVPEVEDGEVVATRGINRDVTEERARERRYESVVETTSDAIILADDEGEIVGWNPAAEDIFGWSQEQILGEPLESIMPESYRERHRQGFQRYLETGESELMGETVEFEGQRADGEVFPIELSLDTYTAGNTTHFCGVVRDITERKEAERALEEERRRLEEAQRVGRIGSWVWDFETGTVDWSRENYRIMGLDPDEVDELTIDTIAGCVHPDDRDVIRERQERAAETGEVPTVEFRVPQEDGSFRWCQGRGEAVVEDGEVVRLMGTNQDITELKRLEQALEDERDRLEEAQRVAGVGSWEWHVPSDTMTFSDEKYRLLGLDPDDPRELDLEALLRCVHPEDRSIVEENRRRAVEEGKYPTIEWRTNPDHGPARWIREEGEAVTDDGEVVLVRGTAMDVTQEKRTLEELKEARDEAVAANQAKSQFLANTSHEIRTPMNAIMGLTDLVLETDLTEAQRDNLETVEASADHLLSIINDLLDLSQLETGRFSLDEVPFDLREVVEESFSLIDTTADQEGLNLAYRYGDDVPEGVVGDAQRVRQVLVNLLSNAVKFTGEGEVVLRVSVVDEGSADDDELLLLFEVEDTGKGIPEEAMGTLFDPYSKAEEGLTTTAEGTGLGLSIARNLVEAMGGSMRVDSVEGRGSTFTFTLPVEPADLIRERPWMGPVEDFSGSRFLVVDDNQTNQEIIEETVSAWGVDVTLTSSAEEALELLDSDPEFDLVLVDYYMPDMNGVEFADRIRADPDLAEIPMILHTSMQRSQQDARGSSPAFADVLVKPVSPSDLFEATTTVLRGEDPSEGPEKPGDAGLGEELDLDVLLAEDNPVNRKVVGRILEERGFEVDRAVDGEEVLEMLRERDYDLVLMDLQMPRLNGLEATEAIRSEFPEHRQPRIVALTAHAATTDRERCMEAGMDGYLSKPVSPDDLEKALREAAAAIHGDGGG